MIIKVCGMRDAENIRAADKLKIQMMGFIFYPKSSRYVKLHPSYMPEHAHRVGVFVDAQIDNILRIAAEYELSYIQLHGNESPSICRQLSENGFGVIKAFSVSSADDLKACTQYEGCCAFFLFDTKTPLYGGSGRSFDWSILQHYNGETPFLLSGGIAPEDTERLKNFSHIRWAGIDLNSRFETEPGYKNIALLNNFVNQINNI